MHPNPCKVQKRSVNSLLGDRRKKQIISNGCNCALNAPYFHPLHVWIYIDFIFLVSNNTYTETYILQTRLQNNPRAPEKPFYFCTLFVSTFFLWHSEFNQLKLFYSNSRTIEPRQNKINSLINLILYRKIHYFELCFIIKQVTKTYNLLLV